MADIQKELNDIKNAVYGREVRGSIHDGIKKINEEVENITDRQDSVEAQFQSVLDETTGKDVISAPEVTAARVGADGTQYPNLKQRLDSEHDKITAQLAQIDAKKADKTHVWSMANMGQDVKEAMTGGSVAVVGRNTILEENIVDKQVTPRKTSFLHIERGKNLFNKDAVILNAQINSKTGKVDHGLENYAASEFIEVTAQTKYALRHRANVVAFYDIDKNFISAVTYVYNFETPPNCYFVRFNVPFAYLDTQQLELGESFTDYEPYVDPIIMLDEEINIDRHLDHVTQNIESIKENMRFFENQFTPTSIVLDNTSYIATNGKYVVSAKGERELTRFVTHLPIKPKKGEKIYLKFKFKYLSSTVTKQPYLFFRDWVIEGTFVASIPLDTSGEEQVYSGIIDITSDFLDDARLYVEIGLTDNTYTGDLFELYDIELYNLTEIFGYGNEPSVEVFNELKDYIDEEGLLDGKRIVKKHMETKNQVNNIFVKPNKNIITLSSAYTYPEKPLWTITYDDESKTIYDYAFPVHQEENVPACFYIIPDRPGTDKIFHYGVATTWEEIKEMEAFGFEIGNHGIAHKLTSNMDRQTLIEHIEKSHELFLTQGISPKHFAHPGGYNTLDNSMVLQEYYESAALTVNGHNYYDLNPYRLKRRSSDANPNITGELDKLAKNGGWLITYHHAVHPNGYVTGTLGDMPCWTPEQLRSAIQYAKSLGIEVVTLDRGLRTYAPYIYFFDEEVQPIFAVQRNGVIVNNPKS